MSILFVQYEKCGTCRKAKAYLDKNGIDYVSRPIKEEPPTLEELKKWHKESGLDLKRFYNTSGQLYRQNNIKDKIKTMSIDEQYKLLASNGMMVKRPIVVGKDFVLVGFKESEWNEKLKSL